MSLGLELMAVAFFTWLGYYKPNPLPFMLAAGASIMLGLHWFDLYVTNTGLAISLMFIAFSFVCVGFAFMCIFWREDDLRTKG